MAETSKPRTPRKKAADAEVAAKPKPAAEAKPRKAAAAKPAEAKTAKTAAEAKPKKAPAAKPAEAQPAAKPAAKVADKAPAKPRKKAAAGTTMVQKPSAPSLEERQRWVATAAYHKAEKRGFAPGYEVQDWLEAEAEIDQLIGKA